MADRRSLLITGGVALIGATAGCLDSIPFIGDDPITFAASPANVESTALDETGYQEDEISEMEVTRTFEAGGQRQDVLVTNWVAQYSKQIELGGADLPIDKTVDAASFTALTTPRVNVLGRTFNPVGNMSSVELAEMVQSQYDEVDNIELQDESTVTVAGSETTVGIFDADARLVGEGVSLEVRLHIAEAVESDDDLIVAIGVYPAGVDGEADNVRTLMQGVEHESTE